ncbi:MAG: uroporphyrinogen decarboxylase [Candidatus Thermoplasmatota archaeon]
MSDRRDSRDLFLAAARGEWTDRVPVWFMRQAGRILPEFRALRERNSFEALCTDATKAAEVTLQPVRRFDVDAAILFSDILVPLFYMDVGLRFVEGEGPVLDAPVGTPEEAGRIEAVRDWEEHDYQREALRRIRESLPRKAVIGFAGAPFTLASYLIEGRSATGTDRVRAFAGEHPDAYRRLTDVLSETVIANLRFQAEAGPDALQLFDTWAGRLSREDYAHLALPAAARVISELRSLGIPLIYYCRNARDTADLATKTGADVLGVDQTLGLRAVRETVPDGRALQGNLDPRLLLPENRDVLVDDVRRVLEEGSGGAHIFNLGEGVPPGASVESAQRVVEEVRAFRR